MNLTFYNTLTKQKEIFKSILPGKVKLYVCGVTVYDHCHIGHARTYVAFDVMIRFMRASGFDVTYVRNITDIDDKIIKRAQEAGVEASELTEKFITIMHEDFDALGIGRPDVEPRATGTMDEMIAMMSTLIEKGFAYAPGNGDVYYRVGTFEGYGKLSGQSIENLRSGERVEVNPAKEDPMDFVLWKGAKPGEPSWHSPWGEGRPGWHIECSAMTKKCLGDTFDIHAGGSDLRFPHHENEIAQSEAANGCTFANYWIHSGMVQVDAEKMSKSLGNFFTIRGVLKKYDAEVVRFFLMSGHYRSELNYSDENLDVARSSLGRLYNALRNAGKGEVIQSYVDRFNTVMADDFNTPEAFAVLFQLSREINCCCSKDDKQKDNLASTLRHLGEVLGVLQRCPEAFLQGAGGDVDVAKVEALMAQRIEARANKDWATADAARDELDAMGVAIEDGAKGTTWRKV
jgi:cysteinyl-tRNA synthetase